MVASPFVGDRATFEQSCSEGERAGLQLKVSTVEPRCWKPRTACADTSQWMRLVSMFLAC